MKRYHLAKILLFVSGALFVAAVGWRIWTEHRFGGKPPGVGFGQLLHSPYLPESGTPDFRFSFLSPWQRVLTPTAVRFDAPMGSPHSALVYNAQKFWEMNDRRGGHHTGDDLNGIGGMNTDFGDPLFAVADGLVVYAADPSPGWGNIVIIAHRTKDGRLIQSMYAHLHEMFVKPGELVYRGQKIASVGTANGYYPAHLHLELRLSDGIDIGAGYGSNPLNRLDPMKTLVELRNAPDEDLSPSPLAWAEK